MGMAKKLLEMRRRTLGVFGGDHCLERAPAVVQNVVIPLSYGEFEKHEQKGRDHIGFRLARWQARVDGIGCDKAVIGCDAQTGTRIPQRRESVLRCPGVATHEIDVIGLLEIFE
ncbi:MAG TPA: hypothetical protein DCX71_11935 [Erythrobacter sp.]|jgi:hypothetical protein|nr:hypothetical protein [Erythrobacter sp.]|tara:strand:- start:36 stop:377 length:342 start_codon:yes stop_codon:yes gene_type:complete